MNQIEINWSEKGKTHSGWILDTHRVGDNTILLVVVCADRKIRAVYASEVTVII